MEEFFLFIRDFNMNHEESGIPKAGAKIHRLCTLVHVEALHQFDNYTSEVGSTIPENWTFIILGLVTHFYLLICFQNKSARCTGGMSKPRGLKIRRYTARM